jgi:hypothetical protein
MESKFKFNINSKQSYNIRDKTIHKKPPGFTVHLLEQESRRTV